MSVRECVQDILALRTDRELPTVYEGIRKWSKFVEDESRPWSSGDLDDLEPDLIRWETIMFLFFEDTMGNGLPVHTRWETVRPFRVTYALQFLNATLWHRFSSKKPDKRDAESTRTKTLFADLLIQAGNAQKMDDLFQDYSLRIFELMREGAVTSTTEITHETLRFRRFRRSAVDTMRENRELGIDHPEITALALELDLLRRAIWVADFYYAYHVLRSTWKSSGDLSALMEKDGEHLQIMMDFFDTEPESFKETKIYHRFIRMRDHLNFKLARQRGIVPSSFFVAGIRQLGNGPVGQGGFADVWKGSMENQRDRPSPVALKLLRTYDVSEERRETLHQALYREAIVWKMTNHPNVLKFVGLGSLSPGCIAMVSPWMRHGNLMTFVQKNNNVNRLDLLSQAARGLYYLHMVNIIHGDLKCANIMVDQDGNAQLADFGLAAFEAVHASVTGSLSRSAGGTPRWQAPELLVPSLFSGTGRITRESDVYAFGMTALELFTEKVPFSHLPEPAYLVEVVGNGSEPAWPCEIAEKRGLTADAWKLMRNCWKRDPSARTDTETLRADIVELAIGSIAEISFTNRWFSQTVGRIRRVNIETSKRGWFDNVWNVELHVPLDGVIEQEEHWSSVSARIVNTAGVDGSRKTKLQDVVRSLRRLRHPNVARVLGLCQGLAPIRSAVIMDFGPEVDVLMTYLRETRVENRLDIVTGIASGLEFLHRRDFVHGDLRTANVIVEDDVPKLVDYGLPSCFRNGNDTFVHRVFKAPELLDTTEDQEETPTPKSDVYALGVTFYEVFAERLPLDVLRTSKSDSVTIAYSKDEGPCHPGAVAERRGLSSDLWTLMCECWSTQPSSRPTSRAIVQRIAESRVEASNSASSFENAFWPL